MRKEKKKEKGKRSQRRAIRHEFEPIDPTLLKKTLGAGLCVKNKPRQKEKEKMYNPFFYVDMRLRMKVRNVTPSLRANRVLIYYLKFTYKGKENIEGG